MLFRSEASTLHPVISRKVGADERRARRRSFPNWKPTAGYQGRIQVPGRVSSVMKDSRNLSRTTVTGRSPRVLGGSSPRRSGKRWYRQGINSREMVGGWMDLTCEPETSSPFPGERSGPRCLCGRGPRLSPRRAVSSPGRRNRWLRRARRREILSIASYENSSRSSGSALLVK